jgi:hypothetical protein
LINSSNGPDLTVFNLTTGAYTGTQLAVSGADFTALNANMLGTELYAADYAGNGSLYLIDLNPLSVITSVPSLYKHDVAVGYSGYIFATDFFGSGNPPGVEEYNPDLSLVGNYIPYNPTCWTFTNGDGKSHCTSHLSGMAWDSTGNLWVSSDAGSPDENGIFEFAVSSTGQLLNSGAPLNFTPDTAASGFCSTDPCRPIGVTVAPPGVLDYAGNTIVANFSGHSVARIDPTTCSGNLGNGGLGACTLSSFITTPSGSAPKYPFYTQNCPNPENAGYVEICKAANTQFPPPNQLYDFTVSGPFFTSGPAPIQVPLGECSGPVQVPAATLSNPDTITEAPVIGVLVSDVTAIAYNSLGMQINQLASWTLPDLNAGVGVQAGDVSLETVATFTNYMVGHLGQLKICKIAGQPSVVGVPFNFTATDSQGQQMYTIEAGPPDQGGYCVLGPELAVNTQATIAETPNSSYPLSNIAVQCDGCTYTINLAQYNVTTTIGAGITEVDFTNIPNMMSGARCPALNTLYSDGPVNGNLNAWSINFTYVTSDTFNAAAGATIDGLCFYAWVYPDDRLETVEVSITSGEDGGTSYFDNAETFSCALYCTAGPSCGLGITNVYACSARFSGPTLTSSGQYWLNLANAVSVMGEAVYWDENDGPSLASQNNGTGPIGAESFLIYGH